MDTGKFYEEQKKELITTALNMGINEVGTGNLSYYDNILTKKFPCCISLGVALDSRIIDDLDVNDKRNEQRFHDLQLENRALLDDVILSLGKLLTQLGYKWYNVLNTQDEKPLTGEFSHKASAVSAGLGWIGKSSLFISYKYGSRISLGTLLTDAPFSSRFRRQTSLCRRCDRCVKACPAHAIKGNEWIFGMERNDLIDVFRCNEYRLNLTPELNRKHSCGLCMKVCPGKISGIMEKFNCY